MTETEANALEARILRRIAAAMRDAYTPGSYGYGGPQDGPDSPPEFDGEKVAKRLEEAAGSVETSIQDAIIGLSERIAGNHVEVCDRLVWLENKAAKLRGFKEPLKKRGKK